MVHVLETQTTFTPLGIRLWDPVIDRQVRGGLSVTAAPVSRPRAVAHAMRTFGDVYAFLHLPGLRGIEYGFESSTPSSPSSEHDYVVQVSDANGRYLPIAFDVTLPLPYSGVYLSGVAASPADATPRGLHLYSAPTRPLPPSASAIRGELHTPDGAPAPHAVVRVETDTGEAWFGLSDAAGRFVVILPYPVLTHGFGGSPASLGHRPLFNQVWPLSLSVLYEPAGQRRLPGADVPDYLSVLQQAPADLYAQPPDMGGTPLANIAVELRFDRHPTVRTQGLSQLLVEPSIASP